MTENLKSDDYYEKLSIIGATNFSTNSALMVQAGMTRSLHANMAKELEITKKFRKNSRDMSSYSPLEICIEVERKRHKALRKKYKAYILKYMPCILKYMPCFFAASNCLKNIVLY